MFFNALVEVGLKISAFIFLIALYHLFDSARIFFWLHRFSEKYEYFNFFFSQVLIGIIMI